jgi:hypothetical protein
MQKYNIIGDIHGHALELKKLLKSLGYLENEKGFYHPMNHQALFVGDLINRGPDTPLVLEIVEKMVLNKEAKAVLGNHEFRMIQKYLLNPDAIDSRIIRFLPWIQSLPLFLDLPELRVVHAAWHAPSIEILKSKTADNESFIKSTLEKNSTLQKAVRAILQGIKIPVPPELRYFDRFGIRRKKARIRWWEENKLKFCGKDFLPCNKKLEKKNFEAHAELSTVHYPRSQKPVFFGHYCLPNSEPKIYGNLVCVDGCVTCDKVLWAYHFDGTKITTSSLVSVKI